MKENYPDKRMAIAAIIVFVIVCCFIIAQWVIGDREGARKNLNIEFAGRVDSALPVWRLLFKCLSSIKKCSSLCLLRI